MLTNTPREFAFTEQDFEKVRVMIYNYAGIALTPAKHDMVYGRLARRLRALGLRTFNEYLQVLERGDSKEFELFTNSLTTNLTSFFRESHHFPMLADHLKAARGSGVLNLWCSASSTGEEPYSMAITACEAFDTLRPPVHIIATDLDTGVLETARQGVYSADEVEKLENNRARRFFDRQPDGRYRAKQELRDLIVYRRVNLMEPNWPIRGPLDAIFCRNVMIYFDKPTQLKVLQRFAPLLKPDGLLFVGHSENLYHAADIFKLRSKTVYERVQGGAAATSTSPLRSGLR
ncbi:MULTISPECIES: CheR family methyltransferase [Silvimonas]|uniref:Chemotaxis protein methyltransferase n=2 Tax=Silvimonas TaxID=300264 RepID=A0ABQ2P572_9NEIS|nr:MULTISPECIES: CheR family methyltransferase [Silvimonas]GGP18467.1 chemotaxis protein methyltransferase [Silvimonas iriomotensis]GGP24669.1 chemotaxis protein methyltransferase [Silvimonas amylolytica]